MGLILGGIKLDAKRMLILRDFPYNFVHCLGWSHIMMPVKTGSHWLKCCPVFPLKNLVSYHPIPSKLRYG